MNENVKHKEKLWGRLVYKRVGDRALITFFGKTIYERVGSVSQVMIFGLAIYQRVGGIRSVFGLVYGK